MKVRIYSKEKCPNCDKAVDLVKKEKMELEQLKVGVDFTLPELFSAVGKKVKSFPQIFVDSSYVGGLKDFEAYIDSLTEPEKEEFDSSMSDFEL